MIGQTPYKNFPKRISLPAFSHLSLSFLFQIDLFDATGKLNLLQESMKNRGAFDLWYIFQKQNPQL